MSKRILVIEDQEDNRQILRDLLTSADFEVIEAADGEAGLAAAAAHRPDLILMDIQLPILDGYEATRRLKADAVLHAIPVIVVTSYALGGDDDKARAPHFLEADDIDRLRASRECNSFTAPRSGGGVAR
jgi:two-component system, cell cycle response regulator DivK